MCRVLGLQGLAFVEEGLLFVVFFVGGGGPFRAATVDDTNPALPSRP